jgi:superfamily II DNA or RNA helicase
MAARTKVLPGDRLTLKDRLSRLTFIDACKLLGPRGKQLIQQNANTWDFTLADDVRVGADFCRVRIPGEFDGNRPVVVTFTLMAEARNRLHWNCSACDTPCEHAGAAFSLLLEEKSCLGLAAAPPQREPAATLDEPELVRRALADREERAKTEKMVVRPQDASRPWTDYSVTNKATGKSYRVAMRGLECGQSYCTCPDFRSNTLGTCKHVLRVARAVRKRFSPAQLRRPFRPNEPAVYLRYDGDISLHLELPEKMDELVAQVLRPLTGRPIDNVPDLVRRLTRLQKLGHDVRVYPDAEEFIQERLFQEKMSGTTAEIRRAPARHPLRTSLLKIPLLPYQLDGIAFAAGAGRAILADDMGLGKTIQGVGTAELLAREAEIKKVLVICPASLKAQWRSEIRRFCDRDVQLIAGAAAERAGQYANDCFFTICNYEQVLRDIAIVEASRWDLIVLDEGQRIKNWEAKTSRVVKGLRSRFALVLSGTPLENRLDDLYSIAQFVDDRRLGPGFRFFNRHRVLDERGKILGYRRLDELRETLRPILLRRTRESVKLDLPPRTTEFIRIAPTAEQQDISDANLKTAAQIASKKFISEMDLLRLQKALLMARMAADSTYLVDKQKPGYSSKLEHLDDLLERLFEEDDRKVIVFSEWTTMLDLIEPLLKKRKLDFVRLDGSVPQKKRQELVHQFQTDPKCRLFLTTNAGSTGLNLQAADTIVNVDLPWNPAVLEQRIARAHRMGQTRHVQVFVLVTEKTIEEKLLGTLAAKRDLALAALDADSDVDAVEVGSGIEELKGRLEVLLGAKQEAPRDVSTAPAMVPAAGEVSSNGVAVPPNEHRERVAAAGGELLGAAFKLLGELVSQGTSTPPPEALVAGVRTGFDACTEETTDGKLRMTFTMPDRGALDQLAQTLARLLVAGGRSDDLSPSKVPQLQA